MILPCKIMCHEFCSEGICKGRVARRILVDKSVVSLPNSGVLYVEKNVMTHWRKTGYSVTDVRNGGMELVQFTNQAS
jgi:hypothetical protein